MASLERTVGMTAFGAKAIDEYLTTLHQQLLGASGEGPVEFIHQSRVYSRRLRAALTIFDGCFQKEHAKLWMRRVKAVTRSLGAARDLDVQIHCCWAITWPPRTRPPKRSLTSCSRS